MGTKNKRKIKAEPGIEAQPAKREKLEEPEEKLGEKVVSSQLAKKIKREKRKKKPDSGRGVILVKNLPHGFFEEQLKAFFTQIGKVTRVRLVRSRKTTRSRGFAFVEFQYPEVAQIAAETINNYMMFRKMIKAFYIPPAEQKYDYFKSGLLTVTKENGKEVLTTRHQLRRDHSVQIHNRILEDKELTQRKKQEKKRLSKIKKTMEKFNLTYDVEKVFQGVNSPVKTQHEEVKSESESEIEEPENLEFEEGSESEANELDSDVSDEADPVVFKKKKAQSVLQAKAAGKKLLEEAKVGKKGKAEKKGATKAVKLEKKIKEEKKPRAQKVDKKLFKAEKKVKKEKAKPEKLVKAAKEMLKKKDQVKLVQKPTVKTTKGKKKA